MGLKLNPQRQGNLDLIISQERIIGEDWLQQGSHEKKISGSRICFVNF